MKPKFDLSKLKGMTKEEKINLLEITREKKRRDALKKPKYVPNEGQIQIHGSKSLDRFVFSGNGGGKTTSAVQEAVWAAKGYNPITKEHTKVPARVIVVLDSPGKVPDVWLPELHKWFEIDKWIFKKEGAHEVRRILLPNGSEIKFMFHLQEPMAFESLECHFVVYDEPPPRHIFIALKRGSRTKGYRIRHLMIGTPLAAPWLRELIYEPWSRGDLADTECFKFSTHVNLMNLADNYLEEFTRHLSDKEKEIRLHGQFFDLDGMALAHLFRRQHHIVPAFKWPRNWPTVIAIDPAMAKAHVACLMGVNPDGYLYYIDELSLKCVSKTFAENINERWMKKYPVIDIICDSMGAADHTGGDGLKSFIEVLKENGVMARSTSYRDKDDEAWIAAIQEVLSIPEEGIVIPKLRIFEGNPGVVADIEQVQWLKYKNLDVYKPKLDITKKDYLACVKYALTTRIVSSTSRAKIISANRRTISGKSGVSWHDREIY